MKGKDGMGRECRARGGGVHGHMHEARNAVIHAAEGAHSDNEPDDALSKGGVAHHYKKGGHSGHHRGMSQNPAARKHRARGGRAESDYKGEEHEPEEKRGGRVHKKHGGMIDGHAKKPHMGRAMRARGGKAGADLNPVTHDAGSEPKGRHLMPERDSVP